MIDLNLQLSFESKPYNKVRNHTVYPLSRKGFDEYVSKDHITHKYLSKIHPKLIDLIYKDDSERVHKSTNRNKDKINVNVLNTGVQKNKNMTYQKKTLFHNYNKYKDTKQKSFNNNLREIMIKKIPCEYKGRNKQILSQQNSRVFSMNKTKFLNTKNDSNLDSTLNKTKLGDFLPFKVPRVDNNKSSVNNFQLSKTGMNFRKKIQQILKMSPKGDTEDLDYLVSKENEKLQNILLTQTNRNFLMNNKLPQIQYTVNQPQFLFNSNGISNSKLMGEKYNPYNYDVGKIKNLTKRNIYGALFNH